MVEIRNLKQISSPFFKFRVDCKGNVVANDGQYLFHAFQSERSMMETG